MSNLAGHTVNTSESRPLPFGLGVLDYERKQIRLLRLAPRDIAAQLICCNVEVFDLEAAPVFQAVSYEWGSREKECSIRVNGKLVVIRHNLAHFLDMFQCRPDSTGYLWIDQICIDQSSTVERNHQVQLMGDIFRLATGVIA